MKDEYQEAKRFINMILKHPSWSKVYIEWPAIEQLKELVDRETPKKPTKNDKANHDWNSRFCPNCGYSLLFKGAGCINNDCRQKIDWSEEEEIDWSEEEIDWDEVDKK